LTVALGWAARPSGSTWTRIHGVALPCGIGFTMGLFIGTLAFSDPLLVADLKIDVLSGSLVSALVGFAVLRFARSPRQQIDNRS
jgi:NhaA family Na+:H+ antiporter